jgi:ketosteroid isomerase-like protein
MADANKRIIQRLFEESWTGNFDAIDEFVSADYVGHDPSEQEPTRGPDGLKEFIARYRSAFEGVRLIVEDQFADGDKVATRWSAAGRTRARSPGSRRPGKT